MKAWRVFTLVLLASFVSSGVAPAQESSDISAMYEALKGFSLTGGSAEVRDLILKRDRVEMRFTGTFYFEAPVAGQVRGAVFTGAGSFRVEPTPNKYEQANVKRVLRQDAVEAEFRSAVLRFTDDTMSHIGASRQAAAGAPEVVQKEAREFNERVLKQTGANIASRLLVSALNGEQPGFFLAEFDTTRRRERMMLILDHQTRVISSYFYINGGEKGMVWRYLGEWDGGDVLTAFYSMEDYEKNWVQYSDMFRIVNINHYRMDIDVRDRGKNLDVTADMHIEVLGDNVRVIPFVLTEGLTEYDNTRLKFGMRVKSAKLAGGGDLVCLTEPWEGGMALVLPGPAKKGDKFVVTVDSGGKFMFENRLLPSVHYPLIAGEWYPRHGDLQQFTFDMTFLHRRGERIASVGVRVREEEEEGHGVSQWKMDQPVKFASFGVGPFERHNTGIDRPGGTLPIEYHSLPGLILRIDEGFITQELRNSMRYFNELFGEYPYPNFGALFHPRGYGQGLPTMLLLPVGERGSPKRTYSFLAHETAHQWWGNIVTWRTYRDQWISEGFAEYSGILFTAGRESPKAAKDLIDDARRVLKAPPFGERSGVGKGKLAEVGPIIFGHRNSTRETYGAYTALIYDKGGLVLRMLHFLFSNPANGKDEAFYAMMKDFVDRHRDRYATTESFVAVASAHFAETPIAKKYGLKDLNWFFDQWVYQARLPSYRLEYKLVPQADKSVVVEGTVYQENAEENWFMPLPLVFSFGRDQVARGVVHAMGPSTPVSIRLPAAPSKVELDPDMWILADSTSVKTVR